MTDLDDVLERLEQFYPDEQTEEEREAFCRWWDNLGNAMQHKARQSSPMDAMVADVMTYDRRTAYRYLYDTHAGYLHYKKLCEEIQAQLTGMRNVNKILNEELNRRFEA